MKLVRFGEPGAERPGLLDADGEIRDLSAVIDDIGPAALSDAALDRLRALAPATLPRVAGAVRLGSPVAGVSKVVAVGLNYRAHAAEANMEAPAEPILFMKATSAITGPNDPIILPPDSSKVDWEVELGVVIGTAARRVAPGSALAHVAGYCIVNDVSERAFQLEGTGQWVKGKSADSFCPLGPWLVTRDAVPDPQALHLWLEVDGERMQDGNTRDMVHPVASLIAAVSRYMTLLPGDVIATGTPAGVALGRKPSPWLRPGQTVRLGIDGLGEQRSPVVMAEG